MPLSFQAPPLARWLAWLGSSTVALFAIACGGDDGEGSSNNGTGTGTGTTAGTGGMGTGTGMGTGGMGAGTNAGGMGTGGMTTGEYPAGPYGTNVGDTIAFLEMEGYFSPMAGNFGPYEDVSMLDIKNSGSPFVLLHLAAMF